MTTFGVVLREHVKQEGLHIVVKRLMVQEELGQQTEILTVYGADITVHLKNPPKERVALSVQAEIK